MQSEFQKLNRKWRDRVLNRNLSDTVDDLYRTVQPMVDLLIKQNNYKISFKGLNVDKVNPMHLCIVLRVTSIARGEIQGWSEALEIAKVALERDKLNVSDALLGLI